MVIHMSLSFTQGALARSLGSAWYVVIVAAAYELSSTQTWRPDGTDVAGAVIIDRVWRSSSVRETWPTCLFESYLLLSQVDVCASAVGKDELELLLHHLIAFPKSKARKMPIPVNQARCLWTDSSRHVATSTPRVPCHQLSPHSGSGSPLPGCRRGCSIPCEDMCSSSSSVTSKLSPTYRITHDPRHEFLRQRQSSASVHK
ncbi:hypothetical protein PC114_g26372 [Phytophthora cactorum]|nr:hypothetical protein PC114_g26372 [Phytophthora cactorum]